MPMKEIIELYTDGGARGNPGISGIGVWAKDSAGEIVFEHAKYIGHQTNNYAEYEGLIEGLQLLIAHKQESKNVLVHMDSELIIKQMRGEYKVKDPGLKKQHERVRALLVRFAHVSFVHIRREQNAKADELANIAMDGAV